MNSQNVQRNTASFTVRAEYCPLNKDTKKMEGNIQIVFLFNLMPSGNIVILTKRDASLFMLQSLRICKEHSRFGLSIR